MHFLFILQVADAFLETKSAGSIVETLLQDFSSRQFNITESCENWTTIVTESRHTETILERIMTANAQVSTITYIFSDEPIVSINSSTTTSQTNICE